MNRLPLRDITEAEIETFWRDGVVFLPGLFDADWVERLGGAFDEAIRDPGPFGRDYNPEGEAGAFYMDLGVWKRNAAFRAFATESPAPAIAAGLMGAEAVHLYDDQIFVKEPGTNYPTPFHQDWTYFHFDGWQICGIWFTVDHVGPDSGSLGYVRGSHRWDKAFRPIPIGGSRSNDLYQSKPAGAESALDALPDIEANPDDFDLVYFDYAPGDCSVHHIRTIHGAKGNTSRSRRRRAVTARFCGDDATYLERPYAPEQGHGRALKSGDPIGGPDYPRVWPR